MLLKIGFVPCPRERCVYIQHAGKRRKIIVVYVDDLIIVTSCKEELGQIRHLNAKELKVVDGCELNHVLGIKVERDGKTVHREAPKRLQDAGLQA